MQTSALEYIRAIPFPATHPCEDEGWKSTTTLASWAVSELRTVRDECNIALEKLNEVRLQLEEQTTQLQDCHHDLLPEYTSQLARIAKLEAAIAPHKRLPPETLSRIFAVENGHREYYIPRARHTDEAEDFFNQMVRVTYPEHVCSLWRSVALNTPALYHSVRVNYGHSEGLETRIEEMTEFSQQIIARGTRSLNVDLCTLSHDQCQRRLEQLALPVSERLTRLSLGHSMATQEVLDACISLLPRLPYLREFIECIYHSDVFEIVPLKYNIPRDVPLGFWTRMTQLAVAGSDSDAFLTVETAHFLLRRCPQLMECWISLGSDAEGSVSAPPFEKHATDLIKLPHLRHLQFHLRQSLANASSFLQPLHLPSLWRLRVYAGYTTPVDSDINAIRALIERSRCNLRIFRFEEQPLSETALTTLLPCLSAVRELALPNSILPSAIVERIASVEYLPKMQQLEMSMDSDFPATTTEEIVKIAESRWDNKNGGNIQHLQCWHDDSLTSLPVFPAELEQKWKSQNRIVRIQYMGESNGYLFA